MLEHYDNVAATGFVEHLKLPHTSTFGGLELLRQLREQEERSRAAQAAGADETREVAE